MFGTDGQERLFLGAPERIGGLAGRGVGADALRDSYTPPNCLSAHVP